MSLPTFTFEIAFGNNPGDSALTYTNVSAYLRKFNYTRGRQYELNEVQAGTGSATLKNTDRRFDPTYTGSPYSPNVVPVVPARLSATLDATTYRMFTPVVERWPQQRTGPTYAEAAVDLVDGFELLTNATLPGATYPQELSGSRVARTLDAAGWSATARNLGAGASQIPSFTFATSDNVQALQHLLDVNDAELGLFFISCDGRATFIDRHTSLGLSSLATFTDQPSVDVGAIGYSDIVATIDKDLIFNDWVGTRSGGTTQEAIDSASITKYFRRTQTLTPLLVNDASVLQQMQYQLSQYKQPVLRIESITISPGNSSTAWTQVLGRDIGDRITVRLHPPGGGAPIVQDSFIQQINMTVPDPHAASAKMVWQLLPASLLGYWFVGFSHVGTDTRAGY